MKLSLWGFYGGPNERDGAWSYMLGEARAAIDAELKLERDAHIRRVKAQIQNRVPLQYRESFSPYAAFGKTSSRKGGR